MTKKILYVFPHPDDESFGPGPAIAAQIRKGHEVHLLTLTKGGATKQRHKYGYSVDEMGDVRVQEMDCVKQVLGLKSLTVWDEPDSGLSKIDPINLELRIIEFIQQLKPDVVVTYAVHGNSGFPDHLVSHAVVKRAFCELKRSENFCPARLALYTISEDYDDEDSSIKLAKSPWSDIDAIEEGNEEDLEKGRNALDCYKTYEEVIEKTGIRKKLSTQVCFEFFGESFSTKASTITSGI